MEISRAVLSVFDKTGLVPLAKFLTDRGVEILSTGGTARHLSDAGIPVLPISKYTDAPEILGGRVKTLNPKIFGGILFDRDKEDHRSDCKQSEIGPIDLVVVNLYPFEATVAREGVTIAEAIEQIDVGGPSMLRAAAKNHRHVIPLCSPSLYAGLMEELERGRVSEEFRLHAAIETFRLTARYDEAISKYLAGAAASDDDSVLGATLTLALDQVQPLRYGENPQQKAAFYRERSAAASFHQLQGKELSYNNLLDLDAAWKVANAFSRPSCTIIKHTNPCGTATSDSMAQAIELAISSDPVSAFGGIIGLNGELDAACVEALGSLFLEVVVAPSFSQEAIGLLAKKKNLRLVEASSLRQPLDVRSAAGGFLIQTADAISSRTSWKAVTKRQPSAGDLEALEFAWILCAHVKSNAIVLTRGSQSVGIGAGQMSRVDAAKIAIMKSVHPTAGCVAASDAFFPFRDGLDILADAGVTAVAQPGGSVRDEEVIAAADERGLAMVFTGERHFRH